MGDAARGARTSKAPWHVWAVGVLSLLWDGSGAYTIMKAQAGLLPGISADEAAYYAAQPMWFAIVTDIALVSAIVGAAFLLLRSRRAVWLFGLSLAAILVTHCYDLAMGTSRAFANSAAMIVTIIILVLAVLQLLYASAMLKRGVIG